ncbi:hypothetical protein AHAS_Ahas04G0129200 [Arachis hypogaea]
MLKSYIAKYCCVVLRGTESRGKFGQQRQSQFFLMSSCSRMVHELDADDEENFNVSEDSENCDATETLVDTGIEAEAEELEIESPDE